MNYYTDTDKPEVEYVFDFICSTLNLSCIKTSNQEDADICYLNSINKNKSIDSQIIILKDDSQIIWNDLLNNKVKPDTGIMKFDIINAIGFFLRDMGNTGLSNKSFDDHQRLKYKESFQYKNGIGLIPIVNQYVLFLKEILEGKLKIEIKNFYPKDKKACIILSHDVDIPDKYDDLKNRPLFPEKHNFRYILRYYKSFYRMLRGYFIDKNKTENWCFDKIIEVEKKYGFKSTSFFSAINNYDTYANRDLDVPYSIKKRKFKAVFKKMIENGFEIGVHASYNAHTSLQNLSFEKTKLERISKSEVLGLRHHYWHLGNNVEKTLHLHEKAGFKYDSSLSFNDNIGFRYSTAFPFYPYNSKLKIKIKTLQIPVFCMDGNLFYNKNMTADRAVTEINEHIETIIENRGVGSIDWHTRTSFPNGPTYNEWGAAYVKLLETLSEKEELWVTSAAEFYKWWVSRCKTVV